jgi:hypothetical protein
MPYDPLMRCRRSIDALQILEYSENIKKLVKKLPFFMHDKWRIRCLTLRRKGNE